MIHAHMKIWYIFPVILIHVDIDSFSILLTILPVLSAKSSSGSPLKFPRRPSTLFFHDDVRPTETHPWWVIHLTCNPKLVSRICWVNTFFKTVQYRTYLYKLSHEKDIELSDEINCSKCYFDIASYDIHAFATDMKTRIMLRFTSIKLIFI